MRVLTVLGLFGLLSCQSAVTNNQHLEKKIDSLEQQLAHTYKPGFGEFMSSIQAHHAKLWFAGQHQNWELADFEIHEIEESLDDIKKYCTDRPETQSIELIDEPLDSVGKAIRNKNVIGFKSGYLLLTNTCNSCHQATDHGFNVITVPTTPPFSNQVFKPKNEK